MFYDDYDETEAERLESQSDEGIEEFLVSRFYPELKYIQEPKLLNGKIFEENTINPFKKAINRGYKWKTKEGHLIPLESMTKRHWESIKRYNWYYPVVGEDMEKCEEYMKKHNTEFKSMDEYINKENIIEFLNRNDLNVTITNTAKISRDTKEFYTITDIIDYADYLEVFYVSAIYIHGGIKTSSIKMYKKYHQDLFELFDKVISKIRD